MLKGILFVLATLCSLALHLSLRHYIPDDAYIHFRVVRNFVDFGEPYFNPGQPVYVSSSPLWTLILSLLKLILVEPSLLAIAAVLNSFLLVGVAAVWGGLGWKLTQDKKLGYIIGVAVGLHCLLVSVSLMETPLALLLGGASLWSYRELRGLSVVLSTLATCVRPEFTLLTAMIILVNAHQDWRRGFKLLLVSFVSSLPVLIYVLSYFGTIVPHGMVAKSVVYEIGPTLVLLQVLDGITSFTANLTGPSIVYAYLLVMLLLAISVIFLSGQKLAAFFRLEHYLLLCFAGCLLLSHFIHRAFVFPWYVPMFSVPVLFVALQGLRITKGVVYLTLGIGLVLPSVLASSGVGLAALGFRAYHPAFMMDARSRTLLHYARQLQEKGCQKVLVPEIGATGYGFPGEIIDAVGIASPEILPFYSKSTTEHRRSTEPGAVPLELFLVKGPDCALGFERFMKELLGSNTVGSNYTIERHPPLLPDDLEALGHKPYYFGELILLSRKKTKD